MQCVDDSVLGKLQKSEIMGKHISSSKVSIDDTPMSPPLLVVVVVRRKK